MMEKSWVWLPRPSNEYQIGARNFVNAATTSLGNPSSMLMWFCYLQKKKSSDPSKVSRSKVWVAGHTHSDGRPVRPEFADTVEKIKSIDSEMASTASTSIREDAVSQVLGRDKPGRVRGMGRGITATKLAFLQARDVHVHKLEKTQKELFNKVENLENKLQILTTGKKPDDSSTSELDSSCRQDVRRCQLLDWYSKEEVVVGEGEYCSSEPMYKVADIPIGPNASAVIVRSVLVENASLWRPTKTVGSLTQAVGVKIAWPATKIKMVDSETDNQTSDSSVHDLIIIYDCNAEENEIVAEGHIWSTDPTEVINDIPIGPNAAVVKVEKVVKKDAYLWRPTTEIYLMEHVLQDYIAWPTNKINTQPSRQASPKASSPKSISCSVANSSSNGKKKTCMLLDCENSGEIVAEGIVMSSNPEDTVHCKPLGPNASKVWVKIIKIGTAKVWRPSAEVECVADALGTTVAWPTDKIVGS